MPSKSSATKFKSQKPSLKRPRDPSPDEPGQLSNFGEGSSQDGISDDEDDDVDSDDADAPRIAQWEADDDTIYNHIEDKPQKQSHQLSDLESNLRSLPLGALRIAQKALASVEPETESESESEPDTDTDTDHASESDGDSAPQEQKRVEWISRDTKKHTRANKHAPTEVTSKKPVSRKRTVVEVPKLVPRDPRFLPMAGEFKPELFRTSYGFLADSRKGELKLLRENLARARKLLSTSPAHLRTEREQEVGRLEKAVKRTESLVNKDRLDSIEQQALKKALSEEKDKQKQGKGKWFLKDSEKRRIVQKARFEALSAEGGHRAVKKAIERKQKKIGQKEKKFRPYAKGAGLESSGSQRRAVYSRSFGQGPSKKQRFS